MPSASDIYAERSDDYDQFLRTYYKEDILELQQGYPKEQTQLVIEWDAIWQWDSDIAQDVLGHPGKFQRVFERALGYVDFGAAIDLSNATVAFRKTDNALDIADLGGDEVDDLITIRGQVAKSSPVKPRLTTAHLVCDSCGTGFDKSQPVHGVNQPKVCPATNCKGKTFQPVFEDSEWETHQLVRVKQPPEDADGDEYIDVHLSGDMAGRVTAGERVDITGVLKTDFDELETTIPEFYLIGHTVTPHESDYEDMDVSERREEFEAIASGVRGDPYELLVDSIAPTIQGGAKIAGIKLAIGLQLFGGWRRPYGDGRSVRGDLHVGLIGEAGTGKSSLLEAAENISPRSGYASGKNASQAGLTAAAVRDDFGDSEWSLEAGAVVKAHKGLCCIDEIDKVDDAALSSLHTALEKQRLEVNKAGIDASLRCQTSVLAAGNPENGEFVEELRTIDEINLGPTLRSRFDLLYTLEDSPDKERDQEVAEHMMKVRQLSGFAANDEFDDRETELIEPAVDIPTLRAWIAYARENVHPVIEDDSLLEGVGGWFADTRDESGGSMNRRNVDAVARLAEASARVRLSETVEEEDVNRAEKLIKRSLEDLGLLHGETDQAEMHTGKSSEDRERRRSVEGIIRSMMDDETDLVDVEDVVSMATGAGHNEAQVRDEIKRLKQESLATSEMQEGKIRML
jgi:replicative DNA helicase Mcm